MLIHKPACPTCGEHDTKPVRSVGNTLRILFAVTLGVLLGEMISIRWRCGRDGTEFLAFGSQAKHAKCTLTTPDSKTR